MQQNVKMELIRSRRKTLSIEIKEDTVLIRAPFSMKEAEIYRFVKEKEHWITEHLKRAEERKRQKEAVPKLTAEEVRQLAELAAEVIPQRVRFYAERMKVHYGRITIRTQKTRWGSCSSKGNLNFNCLLMLAKEEAVDYVVVHELCHLIEMNHSSAFWEQVERVMPDYKIHRQWLKDHGNEIMGRVW